MLADLLRSDSIVGPLIVTTVVYSLLCFVIGFHPVFPVLTILLIAGNAAVSFYRLFFQGRFFRALFVLNLLQLALFAILQAQTFHSFGHYHYEYAHLPGWLDWFGLTAVHFFKAADFVDFIEAYHIELLPLKHRSVQAGIILFSMHIIVDVFLYGAIRNMLATSSHPNFKAFMDTLIRFFKHYRIPMLIGVLGALLLCLAVQCFDRNSPEYMNWFNGHFWIIENILITIDFGDAFQIFGWSIHHIKFNVMLATLSVVFRLIVGSYLLMLLDSVLLHLTGGFGRTPAACEEILRSSKTSQLDKLVALHSLGKYGAESKHATPVIVETFMKSGVKLREAAFDTLLQIGDSAIPELINSLARSDSRCAHLIREALETVDPDWIKHPLARDAVPDLVASLSDGDQNVGEASERLLTQIDPRWRDSAAALSAVPQLLDKLKTGGEAERESAAWALGKIKSAPSKTIYYLARALGDPIESVRIKAAVSLEQIDPDWRKTAEAENAAHFLINGLENDDNASKLGISHALGTIGSSESAAVPALLDLVRPGDAQLCESAFHALDRIDPKWRRSEAAIQKIETLAACLVSENEENIDATVEILKMFGSGAETAVPALMKLFAEGNDSHSAAAVRALNQMTPHWKLGPRAEKMRGQCIKKLFSGSPDVRAKAALILGRFGPAARQTVPHLKKALADEDMAVKRRAMEALSKIGA